MAELIVTRRPVFEEGEVAKKLGALSPAELTKATNDLTASMGETHRRASNLLELAIHALPNNTDNDQADAVLRAMYQSHRHAAAELWEATLLIEAMVERVNVAHRGAA